MVTLQTEMDKAPRGDPGRRRGDDDGGRSSTNNNQLSVTSQPGSRDPSLCPYPCPLLLPSQPTQPRAGPHGPTRVLRQAPESGARRSTGRRPSSGALHLPTPLLHTRRGPSHGQTLDATYATDCYYNNGFGGYLRYHHETRATWCRQYGGRR